MQNRQRVRVTVKDDGRLVEREADYLVLTMPPPLVLALRFSPQLPASTRRALETLSLGPGTKTLLRFGRPGGGAPEDRTRSAQICPSAPCGMRPTIRKMWRC